MTVFNIFQPALQTILTFIFSKTNRESSKPRTIIRCELDPGCVGLQDNWPRGGATGVGAVQSGRVIWVQSGANL